MELTKNKLLTKKVSATLASSIIEDEERNQMTLSAEQRQFYDDHGYFIIRKLFDDALLNSFRKRFAEICNGTVNKNTVTIVKELSLLNKNNPEDRIYKVQELLYDEVFMMYSENPKVLKIVSPIIGDDITAINSMLINKPPGSSGHEPHQDLFYFPIRPAEKIMAMWTAVDHASIDNGCLYVIPGSHKAKVLLEHRPAKDPMKFHHILANEESIAPHSKRVYLDMKPGDTVFFSPYLVHGSEANASQNYRKCMTVHLASSDCHYIDVTGTVQESIVKETEDMFKRHGTNLIYNDMMKIKSKRLDSFKSKL